eukprot:2543265-Pyramimonas_sp.AAC.1
MGEACASLGHGGGRGGCEDGFAQASPKAANDHDISGNQWMAAATARALRGQRTDCLLYTSDAADDTPCVDLG